jgi:hypothetical protein
MCRNALTGCVASRSNVAASRLTLTVQTLRKMVAAGLIVCVPPSSRNWRFQEDELNRFIRSQTS